MIQKNKKVDGMIQINKKVDGIIQTNKKVYLHLGKSTIILQAVFFNKNKLKNDALGFEHALHLLKQQNVTDVEVSRHIEKQRK